MKPNCMHSLDSQLSNELHKLRKRATMTFLYGAKVNIALLTPEAYKLATQGATIHSQSISIN